MKVDFPNTIKNSNLKSDYCFAKVNVAFGVDAR